MATDFKSIPIIDVSPLLAKCDDPKMGEDPDVCRVVKQLDQACREAGFFYVKGHDIPESLFNEVKNIAHEFFDLPDEEKLKINLTPAAGYRGYATIGENITNGKTDMHEGIICYKEFKKGMYGALGKPMEGCNQWPLNPPNFKSSMEEYINLCKDLSRNIMRGIALALGGSPYEFEGERAGDPFWALRIIGYPGVSFSDGQEHDMGCGAHTDYGLLTLINQDDNITALQVRNQSGEWIPAPPIPGSFICNIGDLLEIFSNGLYESPMHRVVTSSPKYRVSLPYFHQTNYDIVVEPLDFCKHRSGAGTAKYGKTVYGERLVSKVKSNFAV